MKAATEGEIFLRGTRQISIHAAREGGDRTATAAHPQMRISIHAAREGGDGLRKLHLMRHGDFNPRRP